MIKAVFLDLDDTLNKFSAYAMQFAGCPIDPETYIGEREFRGQYDLLQRVNSYLPESQKYGLKEFWDSIPRNFWASTPKSDEYSLLLDLSERLVGRDNVMILTAPTKDPDCLAGKLEWIHSYLPGYLHRQYIVTARKHFCAQPGYLLIDDCADNLDKWFGRGGTTLCVPRPWNRGWELFEQGYAYEHLRERLEGYLTNQHCVA